MRGTQIEQLNKDNLHPEFLEFLLEQCRYSKNLYNQGLYEARQLYIASKQYIRYVSLDTLLKQSENYKRMYSQSAQQTLQYVDRSMQSFKKLLRSSNVKGKVNLPHYLGKEGYFTVVYPGQHLKLDKEGCINIPKSQFQIECPPNLVDELRSGLTKLNELRIVPKYKGEQFEIHYCYTRIQKVKPTSTGEEELGVDLGVNNFAACVATNGDSFLIDGKWIKSVNQWYNKELARLRSIEATKAIAKLCQKRSNQIRDFINKSVKRVLEYCYLRGIKRIIVGLNQGWKQNIEIGKKNNQKFCFLPHSRWIDRLKQLGEDLYGVEVVINEESYTSQASFLDADEVPVYGENGSHDHKFSGKRVKRGLYQTDQKWLVNADLNGAANLLRKVSTRSLDRVSRASLTMPLRGTFNLNVRLSFS